MLNDMEKRKTVFCEVEFLRGFLDCRPSVLEPNEENIRLMENWISLYKFICKSDIVLNVDEENFRSLIYSNSWMKKLWKKSTEGCCGLKFGAEKFASVESFISSKDDEERLNAVFFTVCDDDACRRMSDEYGVFVLNINNLMSCSHLYKDNGTAFPSELAKKWDFLSGLNVNYPKLSTNNSLLIIDKYLFDDGKSWSYKEKIEYNLKPILDCLLPKNVANNFFYEIIIISGTSGNDYSKQYNCIKSIIKGLRPNLSSKIVFYIDDYNNRSMFHDRCIVSNNVWISCGHGFDLFKKNSTKPVKSTTVNIAFPFFQDSSMWVDNSFLNVLRDANKIMNRDLNSSLRFWGNKELSNRLISHYVKQSDLIKYNRPGQNINNANKRRTDPMVTHPNNSTSHKSIGLKVVGFIDPSVLDKYRK